MSRKKKCWDCRALESFRYQQWYCQLGFDILVFSKKEIVEGKKYYLIHPYPAGECPKPRTTKLFFKIWNEMRKIRRDQRLLETRQRLESEGE